MRLSRLSWLPLVPILFAAAVYAQDQPASLAIGATAPMKDVKLKSVDGKDVTLASVAGKKGTLVVFTCNHCPWAQAWQTRVASIGNAAAAKGVGVVAINPNDPAAYPEDDYAGMQARAKLLGLKFPYAVDATSDLARAFGATRTPEAFLFDASGKLVYHGTVDDNARDQSAVKQRWLQDAVDAVIAGKEVPTAETKAFGCGIKFREKKES
jgi:peroxiredoxin